MTVALLVMTDGRLDCLERTMASAKEHLYGPITERWMHDDTGDAEHRAFLRARFPEFTQIGEGPRRGFGGAIAHAWSVLSERSQADYVLHLEQDFTFNRHVQVWQMAALLQAKPHIAQVVLRRQPWNEDERRAGGIVEQHPDDYEDCHGWIPCCDMRGVDRFAARWLEHRRFFSTNVCLYRRELMERGWPVVDESEGHFSIELFKDPTVCSAFWGPRTDSPWVHHIGEQRVGHGY